jgi:hypothetical protein
LAYCIHTTALGQQADTKRKVLGENAMCDYNLSVPAPAPQPV